MSQTEIKLNLKALNPNFQSEMDDTSLWNSATVGTDITSDSKEPIDEVSTSIEPEKPEFENQKIHLSDLSKSRDKINLEKDNIAKENAQTVTNDSDTLDKDEESNIEKVAKPQEENILETDWENIPTVEKWTTDIANEKEVTFVNYQSHFEERSKAISKKIRKFRYTPHTRTGFLLFISAITVFSLSVLMLLFPEKHSVQIYKSSILEVYNGYFPTDNENMTEPQIEIQTYEDNSVIEVIDTDWISDETDEVILEISDTLVWSGTTEIPELTEIEIQELKRKRLKDHLYKKYIQ